MKYKLRLDLKLELKFVTLYRIEKLSNGELGGWIESEKNLSQYDSAWVSGDARVYGNAQVYGDARVYGNSWVSGDAWVYGNAQVLGDALVYGDAQVYGNARVYGNSWVSGDAQVYDNAQVYGNALVSGNAWVYGDALVYGDAQVSGNARVSGNALVYGDAQVSGDARVSGNAWVSSPTEILNIIISFKFSVTITPDNVAIGCLLKTRKEWLKITKKQAKELGLEEKYYSKYKALLKAGFALVPERKKK